jgi:hypothetical protein
MPVEHTPDRVAGDVVTTDADAPLEGGTWYAAESHEDRLVYEVEPGSLADAAYLTCDLLLDGDHLAKWELRLHEGEDGPTFGMRYSALNRCQARVRVPLTATNQDRWKYDREGAWLKPLAGGDRVNPDDVDRITVAVIRKSEEPVRWCQTPLVATDEEPERLDSPTLPEGPLADEFGQSRIHEWDGRTGDEAELVERLEAQYREADDHALPEDTSEWGGWTDRQWEATGFFRTHHDGDRWWLVDPDGHPFWSAGLDCVRANIDSVYGGVAGALSWIPDEDGPFAPALGETHGRPLVDYLTANFVRAFGDDWHDRWTDTVLGQLRRLGFNTVGNWSEWEIAREAGYPYVRPLRLDFDDTIYRDFPDVFAEDFEAAAAAFAEPLAETREDPAMIGYFLGNEPTWGFADETPAAGMLYTTETCATRSELRSFVAERYGSDGELAEAWDMGVSFADLESGRWSEHLTDAARADLAEFSEVMVDEFYRVLSEACRAVDPNHLNLGTRYAYVPGDWAIRGMSHVDVFSVNCYDDRVRAEQFGEISDTLDVPVLIGEWHFGALDVGLPASGICRVGDQSARGDAYRVYLEDAAARPWCVGTHYFTLYDQSVVGRFDGENYNIGFLDVCHRPYGPLATAARESHERLYDVAAGRAEPYDDPPEYLSTVH